MPNESSFKGPLNDLRFYLVSLKIIGKISHSKVRFFFFCFFSKILKCDESLRGRKSQAGRGIKSDAIIHVYTPESLTGDNNIGRCTFSHSHISGPSAASSGTSSREQRCVHRNFKTNSSYKKMFSVATTLNRLICLSVYWWIGQSVL